MTTASLRTPFFTSFFRHIAYERDGSPRVRFKTHRAVGNFVRDVRAVRVDGGARGHAYMRRYTIKERNG